MAELYADLLHAMLLSAPIENMGKTRDARYIQGANRTIRLYPVNTTLGWRVIRMVTPERAAQKLATGEWREVVDEHRNFMGCQVVANFKIDEDLPSRHSACSITVSECMLNAGLGGKSRTFGMSEDKRLAHKNKDGRPLAPEDAIERAMAKVREWPLLHGDRAVRVYPPVKAS